MFLDEKINKLKQEFSPTDFKDPFISGSDILKSIESEFILTKDLAKDLNNLSQHFNNWADNIKHKIEVKFVNLNNHSTWLDKLDLNTNYWTVITNETSQSFRHLVYDCKPNALFALFSILQNDFFVVDKKYNWFSYFQVNRQTQQAIIYKSGRNITPFEL